MPLKVAAGTSRPQGRQQQRRSVAVVDAANPQSNFFLPAPGAEKLASSLEAGEFLLLTAHRQAGKTTLAQEIVVQLQERGCLTAVIYLTMLPEKKSLFVLHEILKILKIPDSRDDPKWCVHYPPARRRDLHHLSFIPNRALQSFLQSPSSPQVVLVFEESDAVQLADTKDVVFFFQTLRELKQLPGKRRVPIRVAVIECLVNT